MDADEIWKLVQQDDSKAFVILYEKFSGGLRFIAVKKLKDEQLAEETVNDIFIYLWENRREINKNGGNLAAFLKTLTRNKCIDIYREKNTKKARLVQFCTTDDEIVAFENVGTDAYIEESIDVEIFNRHIEKIVDKMPEQRRKIYNFSRKDGYSTQEIAEELGLSEVNVRVQLHRARNEIEAYFNCRL